MYFEKKTKKKTIKNKCKDNCNCIPGLQEKSIPWKKDMKLFDAWKGLQHFLSSHCPQNTLSIRSAFKVF